MKANIYSGLAAILMLTAISCSKNNSTTSGTSNNRISSSQSSDAIASSNEDAPVSIVGIWTLYYDWDCNGKPGITVTTFNSDGTWTDTEGYTGLWITGKHILTFVFSNDTSDFRTTYSGVIGIKEVHGIQSTFEYAGSQSGCFHMEPYTGSVNKQKDGSIDESGKSK